MEIFSKVHAKVYYRSQGEKVKADQNIFECMNPAIPHMLK